VKGWYIVLAAAALISSAHAQAPTEIERIPHGNGVNAATELFIRDATIGNLFETAASRLALDRSSHEQFRSFAQRIIDDHTKSADELKAAVQRAGLRAPDEMDNEHKEMLDELQSASGVQFDQLYRNQQIKVHDNAVRSFESYADKGQNQELKQFASNMLPNLRKHLQLARDLPPATGAPLVADRTQVQPQQGQNAPSSQPIAESGQNTQQKPPAGEGAEQSRQQTAQSGEIKPAPQRASDQAIATPAADQILASDLRGKPVHMANEDNVGEISDVLLSRDGQVAALVIGVGGFLGIGEKNVAIPFHAIEITGARGTGGAPGGDQSGGQKGEGEERVVLRGMTREDLEAAPEFKPEDGQR